MTTAADHFDLTWHRDWVIEHAQARASIAFLEMQGNTETTPDARGLLLWERRGLDLADEISWWMDGLEEPPFIEQARHVAVEIYLRHLHQLLRTSPTGGAC